MNVFSDLQELSVDDCTVSQEILGRRKSGERTGRLVTVNKQQFALFKYKGIVYAVNEICPHMGKCFFWNFFDSEQSCKTLPPVEGSISSEVSL